MTIRRFELDVRDHPEALRRVINMCRRRNCRIVALSYREDEPAAPARIVLGLAGDAAQTARAERWLANVIDVLAVRCAADAPAPTSYTAALHETRGARGEAG